MFYLYFTLCASAHEGDSQAGIDGPGSPCDVPTPGDEQLTQEVPARKRCCRCTPAKKENADELPPDYEDPFGFKSCAMIPMDQFEYIKRRATEIMEKWGSVTRSELRARGHITCDDDSFLKGEIPDDHQEFFWEYTFRRGKEEYGNATLIQRNTGQTRIEISTGLNELRGHLPDDPAKYEIRFRSRDLLKFVYIMTGDEPRQFIMVDCDDNGIPVYASSVMMEEFTRRNNDFWIAMMTKLLSEPCPECHTKALVIEVPGGDDIPYYRCGTCNREYVYYLKRCMLGPRNKKK